MEILLKHTNINHVVGFAYYVNTPKGSSPLMFDTSGYKVKAESGKIIFELKHISDGRSLISGNFIYGSGVFGLIH